MRCDANELVTSCWNKHIGWMSHRWLWNWLIDWLTATWSFIHSFIQANSIAPLQVHYYSEALPTQHGYCAGVSRHRQLQVKDLPKVPTWRLERDSNPRPFGRKVAAVWLTELMDEKCVEEGMEKGPLQMTTIDMNEISLELLRRRRHRRNFCLTSSRSVFPSTRDIHL